MVRVYTVYSLLLTELKTTEWKTMVHISASSQSSIAAQQKIVLADGSLCSRQQPPYVGVEEEERGGVGSGEWGGAGAYRLAHPPR